MSVDLTVDTSRVLGSVGRVPSLKHSKIINAKTNSLVSWAEGRIAHALKGVPDFVAA